MLEFLTRHEKYRVQERAALYRAADPNFAAWADGAGVIAHDTLTQVRVFDLAQTLMARKSVPDTATVFETLKAVDHLTNAAMWLVVHMTYARNVYLDGRALEPDDFKDDPEGHTGGALNMVPGYAGYMAINALTGDTRSWIMGQGHCVAAIDAVNFLLGNMSPEQDRRYDLSDAGLSRFVRDFYSYEIDARGRPVSPLGSHVNPMTAGGMIEGGYLGFAELLYVHMPLPGERLVAFLSDGAFEEQRASDWVPRWWRAEDSGLVAPVMIANGRRIDQRSTLAQTGGVDWFRDHLRLNGFDPIDLDGRDPAAFAWSIFEMEERSLACGHAALKGETAYPVPLHYGIAETVKGYGFPGAGTNRAHNLPLHANPARVETARREFVEAAERLWVPMDSLRTANRLMNTHETQNRPREREHPLIARPLPALDLPDPPFIEPGGEECSPMDGVDAYFTEICKTNPDIRVRVGNPDEMRSNRLNRTLDLLKHRVSAPEAGIAEAVDGSVITALNEEAVVCAAFGNKGGLNMVASYEAFAVKMLGAIRQEIIFSRHQQETGRTPNWRGVPIMLTSHTWENGKNEQSHQDPTLAEALMGEMADVSRVVFPADWNSAVAALKAAYDTAGQVWAFVAPKRAVAAPFTAEQAQTLMDDGAIRVAGGESDILLTAIGAYQLAECRAAAERLAAGNIRVGINYMLEPGRFRDPRDDREAAHQAPADVAARLFPENVTRRLFVTHTRREALIGTIRPLDTGAKTTRVLGYRNRGGTLDVNGMFFANQCSWAHITAATADVLDTPLSDFLSEAEIAAVNGEKAPQGVLF